ncbi:uncharacterized protein LOC131426254 isoform X3 [Malaya genurostris]|uniref:uncharacterized protein LOC131426254 isoform X3 n=1 Tax=Malaya genurostris TaxID=325434 RepID=UPI0026F3B61F|nr:uncharacterized protein LOC131426254 isoform X3 [Malaya genurostris]
MGTSNNPSDHPVLWSQQFKRIQERRIADASLRDWQHRKHIERQARAKEQAHLPLFQYREVMERYSPWGRKGGGAPNDTVRIRNIQAQGLYPEAKNDVRHPVPMPRPKGVSAGGGGAPLRNSSGQIVTGLKDDPIISFNDANRYHVDNGLRYKTTPAQKQTYRAELDRIVAEKENRRKTRSSDVDGKMNGGPWGKPGPGGKPWRPPKNVGHNFMKSMGWTNKETLQDLDIDLVTKMQRQLEEENKYLKKFSNCCDRCVCQCVSNSLNPMANGSVGSAQTSRPTVSNPSRGMLAPPATAPSQPMRYEPNPSTDKITDRRVPRLCQQGQQNTPGRAPVAKKGGAKITPTRNCMITGGVELVPLLAKRRSQPRPISLGTTDITKIDKYSSNGTSVVLHSGDRYLHELNRQMSQKQRKIESFRVLEFETSKQHFETWSSFWGRPGHGAPLPNKNKLNLDNLLYAPAR